MDGLAKLRDLLKTDKDRFDSESKKHKHLHRNCAVSAIALTGATTVVASLGLILDESLGRTLQFVIVVLTSTTTAAAAWAEMRRARELWQHEREVYYALVDIERELEFRSAVGALTETDLNEYFRRMAAVLGSSSEKWARIQEKKAAEPANRVNT